MKNKLKNIFMALSLGVSLVQIAPQIIAETVFDYTEPASITTEQAIYPRRALEKGDEGYVIFNFMVDTEGQIYDTVITNSTDSIFEKPSLNALEKIQFEPATLNGEPVDSSHGFRFTFSLRQTQGVEDEFSLIESEFNRALKNDDLDKAERIYNDLVEESSGSFYAIARTNFAGFFLAKSQGNIGLQRYYLQKTLAYDRLQDSRGDLTALKKSSLPAARAELFKVQALTKRYGDAIETFEWMERENDGELLTPLRPVYEKLKIAIHDDSAYAVMANMYKHTSWWGITLHKRKFFVDQVEGQIDEIKVHCQAKSAIFIDVIEQQYSIPESWGNCDLFFVGSPNTSFRFVQIPSQ